MTEKKDNSDSKKPISAKAKKIEKTKTQKLQQSKKKKQDKKDKNPETILFQKKEVLLKDLLKEYKQLIKGAPSLNKFQKKAIRRYHREEALKPYQAELIRMQKCLEKNGRRMIILFEGRDAAGKGGTIRRVTRYMNKNTIGWLLWVNRQIERRHSGFFKNI